MNKINIIGLNSEKSLLIKGVMDLGVVEISSQDTKLTDPDWISYVKKDGNEAEVLDYDIKISKISDVLESLDKYDTGKKPLFSSRRNLTPEEFSERLSDTEKIEENLSNVLKLNDTLNELSTEENKIETAVANLKPWVGYDIPLELRETKYTDVFIGVIPSIMDIKKVKTDLEERTDSCYFNILGSDKDQYYCSIICLKKEKDEVYETLKQYGFNIVTFTDLEGTVAENIVKYENHLKDIFEKKELTEESIKGMVPYIEDIEILYDHLVIERDKNKILSNMLTTESTFYTEGWIPEMSKEKVEGVLNKYQCWYEINQPAEDEEYPILLQNNSLVEPFESITALYSLPSSSNIDPTSSMWFFFVLFFGMMFGDVGYGLMLVIATSILLKKFKVEGGFRKISKTLFYAGLSTIFWGVMFGNWFGDALTAAAKVFFNVDFVINPLWLNPLEDPMTVLIVAFALGLIHLFVGLAVNGYMLIRDGKILDAIFDVGFWYLFIIGPVMLLLGGSIAEIGKYITIVGIVGLVLTQGRAKKGIISKLFSGILSLYGITGYLSDVLSYSRLLALGLATGVVSSVLSIIGSMGGNTFLGAILFIVVFVFGHTFNFAINALGSFVHSARLQYVEFFGKFYEGGGEAFNPLMKKTKYIKIIKEEN